MLFQQIARAAEVIVEGGHAGRPGLLRRAVSAQLPGPTVFGQGHQQPGVGRGRMAAGEAHEARLHAIPVARRIGKQPVAHASEQHCQLPASVGQPLLRLQEGIRLREERLELVRIDAASGFLMQGGFDGEPGGSRLGRSACENEQAGGER